MSNLREFSPKVRPVVFQNDRRTLRSNSVIFQNAGNVVVRIDDEWTLYPGGSLTLGSHTDENITVWEAHIAFISDPMGQWLAPGAAGAIKRLEIIEIQIHDRAAAHYVEQKDIRQ